MADQFYAQNFNCSKMKHGVVDDWTPLFALIDVFTLFLTSIRSICDLNSVLETLIQALRLNDTALYQPHPNYIEYSILGLHLNCATSYRPHPDYIECIIRVLHLSDAASHRPHPNYIEYLIRSFNLRFRK